MEGDGEVGEEFWGRGGVGVDEEEPVAGGGLGAGVAGAADLVEGLEDDAGADGAGEVGSGVGGIVIADNDFPGDVGGGEGGGGGLVDRREGGGEEFGLVPGGDDDAEFHPARKG